MRSADSPGTMDSSPLPFEAVIFDMDGVVTRTASVHAAAWKSLFDDFLRHYQAASDEARRPFDIEFDYRTYVDGKPRHDGARSFLRSRGIELPEGDSGDPPEAQTIHGLGKRKDALFERELHSDGVKVFETTVDLIKTLRQRRIKTAVVTSSRHGREVIASAGLEAVFDARVDGVDIHELGLPGKPDPAAFLECARRLGVTPARTVVIEDAAAGVYAGQAGGFGLVIGVNRGGSAEALARHGAGVVVSDLGELGLAEIGAQVAKSQQEKAWCVEQTGFDPAQEPDLESIFTVANGYLGVRGAPDIPLPNSQGDLFVAGIYASKALERPYSEHEFLTHERPSPYAELVSLPFPFRLELVSHGERLTLGHGHWRTNRRILDMKRGILRGEITFASGSDQLTDLRTQRFASRAERHLILQEICLCSENYSGDYRLNTSLVDPELADLHPHLLAAPVELIDGMEIQHFRTRGSNFEICLATRTLSSRGGQARVQWRIRTHIGEDLRFRRFAAVFTSRDHNDPRAAAVDLLRAQSWESFDAALAAQQRAWEEVWQRADISLTGSPATCQALRFDVYHLTGAADYDPRVSVGARALTGRAYEGHVFWDVEIFMLPFYLHTQPAVARNLLRYRHHTLNGARQRARELGYQGACFAWESTVSGEDVTPRKIKLKTTKKEIPIFTGTQQVHVAADVAHGVWRYWEATQDDEFMAAHGVEILVETARFWCSRCTRVGSTGMDGAGADNARMDSPRTADAGVDTGTRSNGSLYHIRGVIGPDEYHHGVNDNAYTNWMAWFNLNNAIHAAEWLGQTDPRRWTSLSSAIGLRTAELDEWRRVAEGLYRPMPGEDGVIEQFEGFFKLGDYTLPAEERFKAPISRLFDWDEINRLKLIKQADVLMLLHLFPDLFSPEVVAANYAYYEPLTDHGSSLSPGIHAAVAARLGRREEAEHYWRQSLFLDLSNVMHNGSLGVHPAAMAGTWQALVYGFLGVTFQPSGPVLASGVADRLPKRWRSLTMNLAWRGRYFSINVETGNGNAVNASPITAEIKAAEIKPAEVKSLEVKR
jgi:alpha,alpha-trehalose phosphorylase